MSEIREVYLKYLVSLGFTRAEAKITWNGVDEYFTGANELTKEVITRDILKGETTLESLKSKYNELGVLNEVLETCIWIDISIGLHISMLYWFCYV